MNLKMLMTFEYWFAIRPPAMTFKTAMIFTAFFGLLLIVGVACKAIYRKLKKADRFMSYVWRRASTACTWLGVFGLVMTFFRYQGVPLLGMRLLYIVWLVAALGWAATIAWYRYKELPKLLAANHQAAMR